MATKAKRKLTDITFDGENAHIALVSKEQQPANGQNFALVLKSKNTSPEFIAKAQQIQVTLDLPDFLEKFFGMYGSQAEVLARLMGYVPPVEDTTEYNDDWYENYIQEQVDSFVILKSLNDSDSLVNALSELNEDQYLALLQDQSKLEQVLLKAVSAKESGVKPDNSTNASVENKVEPSGSKVTKSKENKMTLKSEPAVPAVEMIEKSAFVDIQKSLDETKVELQKALEIVKQYEQEKKELIVKAKSAKFDVVKDEKIRTAVIKAGLSLESEDDFDAFLAAITSMVNSVETSQGFIEKSALFQEQGATVETEVANKESAVARILKAKNQVK